MMTRLRSRVCPREDVCVRLVPSAVFRVPRPVLCEWRRGLTQQAQPRKAVYAARQRNLFAENVLILPDTQEGTVPHRDRPARFPWSVGETHKQHTCKQDGHTDVDRPGRSRAGQANP
jgi:hypothetical protein